MINYKIKRFVSNLRLPKEQKHAKTGNNQKLSRKVPEESVEAI